jgi:hypothetical protein
MMNEHVLHLASLADIGTQVTVVKHLPTQVVAAPAAPPIEAEPDGDERYARDPYEEPQDDPYAELRNYDRYDRHPRYDRYGDPL